MFLKWKLKRNPKPFNFLPKNVDSQAPGITLRAMQSSCINMRISNRLNLRSEEKEIFFETFTHC